MEVRPGSDGKSTTRPALINAGRVVLFPSEPGRTSIFIDRLLCASAVDQMEASGTRHVTLPRVGGGCAAPATLDAVKATSKGVMSIFNNYQLLNICKDRIVGSLGQNGGVGE